MRTSARQLGHAYGDRRLAEALRSARLAEAARFDALIDIRDAATLRLQVLKDELEPILHGCSEAREFTDLMLVPGDPPRLWIDMVSYVLMKPDPRTYRFQQDTRSGYQILFETSDRREMADRIIDYAAHRLIERQLAPAVPPGGPARAPSGFAPILLAWLCGLAVGVLALFIAGVWLANLQ